MLDASVSLRPEYGGQQTCRDADHRDLKVAPNGYSGANPVLQLSRLTRCAKFRS